MKKTLITTVALLIAVVSQANTIIVNNTNDSGAGSLRQASIDANSGDTIRFNPNLLTAAVDSISLVSQIDFGTKGIVIKGLYSDTDTLFISGGNSSGIFKFQGAGNVVLDSLVLINGVWDNGGAVLYNDGDSLHIVNSVVSGNSASNNGGGIYAYNSSVTISHSTISNNKGNFSGGGIYAYDSPVTVSHSTISGNSTDATGGGILTLNSNVTINHSTISGNSAGNAGGGIYTYSEWIPLSMTVRNSTISGNSAVSGVGGLYTSANFSTLSLSIGSSIVTDNTYIFPGPSFSSDGYNIFSDAPFGVIETDQTNVTAAQLNLGPLQQNGGTTRTMLPKSGSVAIDLGNPTDMSDAQNRAVSGGRRDVGSAETTTTGINENSLSKISIYPNPTTASLIIENKTHTINAISILDTKGRVIKTAAKNTKTIDVANMPKGIYFLQIHTDSGLVNKKFIKE